MSRARVAIDPGGELYVEPRAFVASGNDVLLAGWPAYRFARNPNGTRRHIEDEHLFGVILPDTGSAIPVRTPMRARLVGSIRAIPDGRGRWEVLFSETDDFPVGSFERPDSVLRLWYGILGPSGDWRRLDTVPIHPDLPIPSTYGSSRLLRVRDTLFWATVATVEGWRHDVALFWRAGATWHHERIVTRRAGFVDIAHDDSAGLIMAVVRPDSSLSQDVSSLFLYARDPRWHLVERLALGLHEPTHYPRFTESNRRLFLTWYADTGDGTAREVRTISLSPRSHESPVAVESAYPIPIPPMLVQDRKGEALWGTLHQVSSDSSEPHRIRFSRIDGSGPTQIGDWANPYVAGFRPAIRASGELVTTGAIWDPEAEVVSSLIVRNQITYCGQ